jgi:regulator of protease activity HflC (stomatin/prohibitin superfamily)
MTTYTAAPNPGMILKVFGGLILLVLIFRCFTVIPAGHVGVVDFFGKVSDSTLKPGVNFRNPLAQIHKFSVKTQEEQRSS